MIETDLFKKLKSKDSYSAHIMATMQNILAMTKAQGAPVPAPMGQQPQQGQQQLPNQQLRQEAPNNKGGETTNLQS